MPHDACTRMTIQLPITTKPPPLPNSSDDDESDDGFPELPPPIDMQIGIDGESSDGPTPPSDGNDCSLNERPFSAPADDMETSEDESDDDISDDGDTSDNSDDSTSDHTENEEENPYIKQYNGVK